MGSHLIATTAVGALLIIGLATRLLKRRAYDVGQLKKPTGAHWLWGHEFEAWNTPNSEWYIKNSEEHGLVVAMKGALLHPDLLAISDPAALHHIYTYSHRFTKSPFWTPLLERLIGRGLGWAERAEHTRQRQMASPSFTAARVKGMEDDALTATENFMNRFQQHVLSGSALSHAEGIRVDVLDWLAWPTLDITGRVALGYDFGCGESVEAKDIQKAWKELVGVSMTFPGFVGPLFLRAFPWISALPLAVIQAQGTVKVMLKRIAKKIVDEMKQAGEDDVHTRNNLLGNLMRVTDVNNEADVDMVLDQINTFVFGGHQSTTTVMSMTLLELARRKDIQTSLRKEIMEFNGSGPGGQLNYDDLLGPSLPLLDAICKEGLRTCPVSSHAERVATEDDVIPLRFPITTKTGETLNAIRVQKGQLFYIPSLAINLNTQMWGADGHKFDPYRWIEPGRLPPSSNLTGGINGHFTFIEGPRICVGYRLATFEIKVILSQLVKNFEFDVTEESIRTTWASVLQPYVEGQKELGPQVPLLVKPVDI